jgi:hypothetical protein
VGVIPATILRELLGALDERKCVPFLGAGACCGHNGTPGLPLGDQVAARLIQELQDLNLPTQDIRNPQNLIEVATHYEQARSRPDLLQSLRALLPHQALNPLPTHVALSRLPLRLLITTNYDTLLERALDGKDPKVPYRVVVQPASGFPNTVVPFSLVDEARTIIYKIHGSFEEQDADNLVVTADDYFRFLVHITKREEGVPSAISARMATGYLLFLGYSLEDWDFRVVFKMVEEFPAPMRRGSVAVVRRASQFARAYWSRKAVTLIEADVHVFAQELADSFEATGKGGA